jgi:hypothetical protein
MQGSLHELKSAPMTQITLSRTRLAGWLLLQGFPVLALACVGHVASAAPGTGHTVHASRIADDDRPDDDRRNFSPTGLLPSVIVLADGHDIYLAARWVARVEPQCRA